MIVLAWIAFGLALVITATVYILVREAARDEEETIDAELTRRLERAIDDEFAGAQEGRWPQ